MVTESTPLRQGEIDIDTVIARAWRPAPLIPDSVLKGALLLSSPPIPWLQWAAILGAGIFSLTNALAMMTPIYVHAAYQPEGGCDQSNLPEPVGRGTVAYAFRLCEESGTLKLSFLNQIQMIGAGVGVLLGGALADRVGRYKTALVAGTFVSLSMFLSAMAPTYEAYAFTRFITGTSTMALSVPAFTMVCEWVPKAWMVPIGVAFQTGLCFAGGEFLLAVFGMHFKAWREFLLVVASAHAALTCMACGMIRESPRWLASQPGRREEALQLLGMDVKGNDPRGSDHDTSTPKQQVVAVEVVDGNLVYSRAATWAMSFLWFTASLTYFGISLAIADIGGDLYSDAALSAMSEIPAAVIAAYLLETPSLGRRLTHCMLLTFGGLCCLALPLLPYSLTCRLSCMFFGKLCLSAVFCGIYGYTSELYLPACRGKGIAVCSAMARVGSIVAPLITGTLSVNVSYTIFGYLAFLAAFACWTVLPETGGSPLAPKIAQLKGDKT